MGGMGSIYKVPPGRMGQFLPNFSYENHLEPIRYIDRVQQAVGSYFNHLSGNAYLRILDTPHVWGMPFGKEIMPQAVIRQAEFERAIVEIIQKTKYRCDVSSLNSPDPDWAKAILGAIDTCLTARMGRTQPVQFRFLFGITPTGIFGNPANYVDFQAALIRLHRERSSSWEVMPEIWMGKFSRLAGGILTAIQLQVFGTAVIGSDDTKMTWNHTKVISVDGTEALVGGHNLNMDLFRSYPPVHDVSLVVHGAAAYGSQLFLNQMWSCTTELLTKEFLNTNNLTWINRDRDTTMPGDPLTQPVAISYMQSKQNALIALHRSGKQTGTDPVYPTGEQPIPTGIKDQDIQTLTDLNLTVFNDRIVYNTYQGFSEYKLASRMLTLGKYWNGPAQTTDFKKASEVMKKTLIMGARNIIRMSQMDLVSAWKKNWSDHMVCQWLIQALLSNPNLQVQFVVSPLDAGAGAEGDQYSFGSGASRTFDLLKYYMTHDVNTDALLDDSNGARAKALTRLRVAPLYYTDRVPAGSTKEGDTYKWPNLSEEGKTATLKQPPLSQQPPVRGVIGSAAMSVINASGYIYDKVPSAPGNHAKIMIVDDQVYVIGSDNLYPGFLSEIDHMVEGSDSVNELINSYWNPLWKYSGPHSISGG
ncbi:MAG: phospholipase [Bacteroidota bacterium]